MGNVTTGRATARGTKLIVNPFLHIEDERIYSPLSDRSLAAGEPDHALLRALVEGSSTVAELPKDARERLAGELWLVPEERDVAREFRLKYVSLETHTVCNQGCYFCPVSVDRRKPYFMPTELFERLVGELAAYRDTIEAVSTINYNEPTVDRRFVEQIRTIQDAGLPAAVVTNGWGLTPEVLDALAAMGGVRHLIVNLSTLDRERYRAERGADHLTRVLANLEHARTMPLAEEMKIVVLGRGDEAHRADFAAVGERFAGSHFATEYYEVMDRAGHLPVGLHPDAPHRRLCGCENVGSRPLQHIHITPQGRCVLCCEDYDERYVVGDLNQQSVAEVLGGEVMAMMRRWTYGLEEAPDDFICRKCIFALTRPRPSAEARPAAPEELRIRPLRAGDEAQVNEAFNRVFRTERTLAEWSWKFAEPEPPVMLAWRGDRLLAQYAALPARFQVDGATFDAAQIVDVFSTREARRELRRRGVWIQTVERFFAHFGESGRYPLLYGFPGARALRLGVLQLGYDSMAPQAVTYLRRAQPAPASSPRRLAYRADLVSPDAAELDRLWGLVRDQYPVAVVRDAARLGRRLGGHPSIRYHCFLLRRRVGGPVGFVAFRTDGGSCRWVELLWDHRHPGALALAAHLGRRLAAQTGCEAEELWLSGDPAGEEVLHQHGFVRQDEPSGLVVVARSFTPKLDVASLPGRLYVTMADADLV